MYYNFIRNLNKNLKILLKFVLSFNSSWTNYCKLKSKLCMHRVYFKSHGTLNKDCSKTANGYANILKSWESPSPTNYIYLKKRTNIYLFNIWTASKSKYCTFCKAKWRSSFISIRQIDRHIHFILLTTKRVVWKSQNIRILNFSWKLNE